MVRDDYSVTPEHSRRRCEGVGSHSAAQRGADAEIITRADAEAAETTEVVVKQGPTKLVMEFRLKEPKGLPN